MRFKITKFCEGNFPMTTRLPNLYFKHKLHWRNLMVTSARKHAVSNSSELQYLCQVHFCPCVHQNLNYHRFYRLESPLERVNSINRRLRSPFQDEFQHAMQTDISIRGFTMWPPSLRKFSKRKRPTFYFFFSDTRLENNRNVFFRIGGHRGESWSCKCRKHKYLTNIQDIQKRLLPQGNGVSESRNAWTLSDTL